MGDGEVTRLLVAWRQGDEQALDALMPSVYDELRRLAHKHLNRERQDHTLNTTDLVHEAYLNLAGGDPVAINNRTHFFAIASRVMRRLLIWYARRRNSVKRGGGMPNVSLEAGAVLADQPVDELLALDQAMGRLEVLDQRLCRVVECRYFGGMTVEETATALEISSATVKRDWRTARTWLRRELTADNSTDRSHDA
ncbi:MAG: sigma-70 family RNA polymerase sigma factor [Bacteroidota bacterium]